MINILKYIGNFDKLKDYGFKKITYKRVKILETITASWSRWDKRIDLYNIISIIECNQQVIGDTKFIQDLIKDGLVIKKSERGKL